MGVAVDAVGVVESLGLDGSSVGDALADGFGGLAVAGAGEFAHAHGGHVDVQVDAVEQRAADAVEIFLDGDRRAGAVAGVVVEVAAGAGVHRADEQELRGELQAGGGARDGDGSVFERLAQDFERGAGKLGHFVEKEHAFIQFDKMQVFRQSSFTFWMEVERDVRPATSYQLSAYQFDGTGSIGKGHRAATCRSDRMVR